MAVPRRSLAEVQELISSAHEDNTVAEKLQFYDCWALEYEHDVEVLEYRAPRLAAECLASAFPADRDSQIILDVACGTGLVAVELYRHGFRIFHGMDGSEQMLQHARQKKLYQELKQSILGQEPLAAPTEFAQNSPFPQISSLVALPADLHRRLADFLPPKPEVNGDSGHRESGGISARQKIGDPGMPRTERIPRHT
ncbi:methyltransferase-like protein 27 isoform X5 [Rhinatrema bivittatum]|uniref:methyltransferase-like protein 27 isoform X5 n=1 Tax=Rhinatrema bivittatum TaxID=194408 RepID=UPI00112988C1|nr:methyltransferase-like protein 27 isoform X5 [Rhinatrema bivittatum]